MRKPNRTCCLCGTEYFYCPSCSDGKDPSWKVLFDNENCKKIFNVLTQYNFKHITSDEAKVQLENCVLDVNMKERDRNMVNEIMNTVTVKEFMTPPIIEEVVEKHEVETVDETVVEEIINIEEIETAVEEVMEESIEEQKPKTVTSRKNKRR